LREIQDLPGTIGKIACPIFASVAWFLEALPSHLQSARVQTHGVAEYRWHLPIRLAKPA
jgi:hypothetical protein